MTRHAIIAFTLAVSGAVLLSMSWKPRPWLVWNATASTPIGLYRIDRTDTFAVGDLVIAIPPEPIASFLADRGFLPRGVPLIKRVLALSRQPFAVPDSSSQSVAFQWEPLGTTIDVAGLSLIGKGVGPLRTTKSF